MTIVQQFILLPPDLKKLISNMLLPCSNIATIFKCRVEFPEKCTWENLIIALTAVKIFNDGLQVDAPDPRYPPAIYNPNHKKRNFEEQIVSKLVPPLKEPFVRPSFTDRFEHSATVDVQTIIERPRRSFGMHFPEAAPFNIPGEIAPFDYSFTTIQTLSSLPNLANILIFFKQLFKGDVKFGILNRYGVVQTKYTWGGCSHGCNICNRQRKEKRKIPLKGGLLVIISRSDSVAKAIIGREHMRNWTGKDLLHRPVKTFIDQSMYD
jgi:hypothetical protein